MYVVKKKFMSFSGILDVSLLGSFVLVSYKLVFFKDKLFEMFCCCMKKSFLVFLYLEFEEVYRFGVESRKFFLWELVDVMFDFILFLLVREFVEVYFIKERFFVIFFIVFD